MTEDPKAPANNPAPKPEPQPEPVKPTFPSDQRITKGLEYDFPEIKADNKELKK